MSKFSTILRAIALCFAMASAAHYSEKLQINTVWHDFNFALREVQNAFHRLNLQSAVIGLKSSQQNYNTIEEFRVNITREMEELRPLIDVIITKANSTFNETQCRSYWVEWEAAGRRVLCLLKATIPSTVNATLVEIKEALNVTSDALTKLELCRDQANSCQGNLCNKIVEEIGVIYRNFSRQTRSILCRGSRVAEALKIRQVIQVENLYDEFLVKGNSLIQNTLQCVNTTHNYS